MIEDCIEVEVDSEYIKRTTINSIDDYLINHGFINEDYTIDYIDFDIPTNIEFTMLSSHLITPIVRDYLEVNNFNWIVINTDDISSVRD